MILSGASGAIEVKEPKFLDDDLEILYESRLLLVECNGQGSRVFKITREAVKLLNEIKKI